MSFGGCSWAHASKDFAEVTDINQPLCVILGPSLDWFFGYQSIDGQQKWIRKGEKGPDLKYGHFYKSCLFPCFPISLTNPRSSALHTHGPLSMKNSNIEVSGSARQAAYDNLESWLRLHASKPWDMPQTRAALGPKGSYFATSPAGGATWSSIPSCLEKVMDLKQPCHAPSLVALGVKETWFALWPDGSSSCKLDSEYQKLEELLRRHGKSGVNVS